MLTYTNHRGKGDDNTKDEHERQQVKKTRGNRQRTRPTRDKTNKGERGGGAKINTHKKEDESGELEKQKHKNVAKKKR